MKKVTRWSPDTCNCVLEYEWDTDVPEDSRVHTMKTVVPCNEHKGIARLEDVYNCVVEENRRKNTTLGKVLEAVPELAKMDGKGNVADVDVKWSFAPLDKDGVRKLHLTEVSVKNIAKINTAALPANVIITTKPVVDVEEVIK